MKRHPAKTILGLLLMIPAFVVGCLAGFIVIGFNAGRWWAEEDRKS